MKTASTEWSENSRECAALLARAGIGDRAAFAALYERTSGHLFAVVLRIQRDRAQAEDILQEVFVKIWRAARVFDAAQSQPMTWLTSIARNQAIDSLRRQQTKPTLHPLGSTRQGDDQDPDDAYDNVEDAAAGPLELLSQASDAKALSVCMQSLTNQQRQCVALAFYNGLSHAEVAEQMRQPLGSVKSWVRRGLQALKTCLLGTVQTARVGR